MNNKKENNKIILIAVIALSVVVVILAVALGYVLIKNANKQDNVNSDNNTDYEQTDVSYVNKVVFEPDVDNLDFVDDSHVEAAKEVIRFRLDSLGLTEAKVETEGKHIVVLLPEVEDPADTINYIGQMGRLTFNNVVMTEYGLIVGDVVMEGNPSNIIDAKSTESFDEYGKHFFVELRFTYDGKAAFKNITQIAANAAPGMNMIAICLDGVIVSAPTVMEAIDSDTCVISGDFTKEDCDELAGIINSGLLPFSLKTEGLSSITSK